jgi:hypothetical protein
MLLVSSVHCTSSATFTATAIDCVQALLPFVIGLYEYASSGRNPALWFVWQLPSSTEEQRTAHAKLTALCHPEVVPRTITAHQEKQLAALYRNPVLQLSKATVTFLLREVFGMGACGSSEKEKRIKALVDDPQTADELADFIAAGYDVSDMRFMNGKSENPAFQPFMNILAEKLEARSELAAEERRRVEGVPGQEQAHGTLVRPTPLAPSMRALHAICSQELRSKPESEDKLAKGEWKIPSLSAFCDRMSPSHPNRQTSLRYSGTAGIVWKIQRRTLRKLHEDAHYNNAQGLMLRQHMLELASMGIATKFVSDDDKCKISVGQPGQLQTAATRARRVPAGVVI